MSAGLLWLVSIYGDALRDARYLDGWLLAGGMSLQIGFHIAVKTAGLAPKSAVRWRKVHIFAGYLMIVVFVSHCDFSWPDTNFEWVLWAAFMAVTLSGLFGTYLARSRRSSPGFSEYANDDRISARHAELTESIRAIIDVKRPDATDPVLPAAPYQAWIADLYANHLKSFFNRQSTVFGYLARSQRRLARLTGEIETLSRYVDQQSQETLDTIKTLVAEKGQLDDARVHLELTKAWLYVHVPVTYALIVLTCLHIIVVYAFSSGAG